MKPTLAFDRQAGFHSESQSVFDSLQTIVIFISQTKEILLERLWGVPSRVSLRTFASFLSGEDLFMFSCTGGNSEWSAWLYSVTRRLLTGNIPGATGDT